MIREEPATRVITGRPTLAEDSNKAQKKYRNYAMISHKVLFNVPAVKKMRTRQVPIMWIKDNEEGVLYPHKDALLIKASVVRCEFNRILVDSGSSDDVLFKGTLDAKIRLFHDTS